MKKTHIIMLVAIAVTIVALIIFSAGDFSTYDTISSAQKKQGKFVHLIAKLDKTKPIEYDPINNPNYLAFYAVDSLGGQTKVIYHNSKPTDIEKSERIVLKGKMQADHFECKDILLKCPSKYKDDKKQLEKTVSGGEGSNVSTPSTVGNEYSDSLKTK
ncbi:MAG: cytochrome c maturation protein CcmE [Chitinophagaceae bacterium]|nr:cytochrome c maturation protein CcmE [Chitinophagaceae bacterium]